MALEMIPNLKTLQESEDGKILDAKSAASERLIQYRAEWWKSWIRLQK